jgi:hypothetical protein
LILCLSAFCLATTKQDISKQLQKVIELVDDGYKWDLDISSFVPLGFELMAIGIKANKFSIFYIVNKRHDITEHTNQQL